MLKITPDPKFTTEVKITVPGVAEPVTVKLTFKYRTRKEMLTFLESEKEKQLPETIANDVVLGWDGFDAEFSKENLSLFLENYPAAAMEIWVEYNRQLYESRVKN